MVVGRRRNWVSVWRRRRSWVSMWRRRGSWLWCAVHVYSPVHMASNARYLIAINVVIMLEAIPNYKCITVGVSGCASNKGR